MSKIYIIALFIILCSFGDDTSGYIKVSKDFADKYNGYTIGVNQINAVVDTSGDYYISENTLYDFPQLFEGIDTIYIMHLSTKSFLQKPLILNK